MAEWVSLTQEEIEAAHGTDLYDSYDVETRERVDLSVFPLLDDAGQEMRVYDRDGFRVARRGAIYPPNAVPCGVLVNLHRTDEMFNDPVEEELNRLRIENDGEDGGLDTQDDAMDIDDLHQIGRAHV